MSEPAAIADVEVLPTKAISAWDVCLGIVPALACLPLLVGQAVTLWISPPTKIGLFIWLVVTGIVVWRSGGKVTRHVGRIYMAFCLYAAAVGALAFGLLTWSFNWGHLAASLFLIAWGLGRCSHRSWHEVVSWGLLFLFTLPSVLVYQDLDVWLTSAAASLVSVTLEAHGVLHHLEGVRLSLSSGAITITSTGTAKLSLYAVICLTAVWCWVLSRSFFHSLSLMLGALMCQIAARFAGNLVVSWGMLKYDQDWTLPGNEHYAIAIGVFALTILLILFFDQALAGFLAPIPSTHPEHFTLFAAVNNLQTWPRPKSQQDDDDSEELAAVRQRIESWRLSWYSIDWRTSQPLRFMIYALAGLCAISVFPTAVAVVRGGLIEWPERVPPLQLEPFRQRITAASLPASEGAFQQIGFKFGFNGSAADKTEKSSEDATGVLDASWIYQWQGYSVRVMVSAPHRSWQAPIAEGESRVVKSTVTLKDDRESDNWPWYDCRQISALGGDFYLFQCGLSDDLTPALPADNALGWTSPYWDKLSGKVKARQLGIYEIRINCESGGTLPIDQLEVLQAFFKSIRTALQKSLTPNLLEQNYVRQSSRDLK